MSNVRRSLVLGVLALSVACAPGRMADLRDSGQLSVGIGLGLSADAKAGVLTHPSLGFASATADWGFESRDIYGSFYSARTSEPYASYFSYQEGASGLQALNDSGFRAAFEVHEWDAAFEAISGTVGRERPTVTVVEVSGVELDERLDSGRWLGTGDPVTFNTATDFQLGATLLFVSARAGVNVLETLDFLLGFVGLDIAGDDQE
jgi:hypothetical protein